MAKSTTTKKSAKQAKVVKAPVAEILALTESSSEGEDSEDDGVDEAGMEKLLEALGQDGLDEFDQAQLQALNADDEDDSNEEEGSNEEGSEDERQESENEDGKNNESDSEEIDGDDEELIALDEVDDALDPDTVPRQKIQVDNKVALARIRDTIKLDELLPWTETLVLNYPETIIVDVDDDLNRELAFYKQALHGANAARSLAAKHNFPFTRPIDYFAEMVKSDSHMERIRQRLLDEGSSIKKSEDKRKEREGKKFGKQVQVEKLKERERSKKDMDERLKGLKRKRQGALDNAQADDEGFDVAVEDAISERPAKRGKGADGHKMSRTARDGKFGYGGVDRRSKQNTRESTDDFDNSRGRGGGRGGRGGARGGRGASRGASGGRGGGRGGSRGESRGGSRGGAAGGRGGSSGGKPSFGKTARGGGSRPGKSKRENARSRS